jgi:hypothetical protein
MRRALWAPAALAMLAAIVAGCGNSAAGSSGTDTHAKAVKFAECMRDSGVSAFPDPGPSGAFTVDGVVNGSSLDPNSTAWKNAIGACEELEPPGFTGAKVAPEQRTARLDFAKCMRDHGVPDFPDPTPNGPLIDTARIPSLAGKDPRTDPGLNAAMHACRNFAAAAGVVGK